MLVAHSSHCDDGKVPDAIDTWSSPPFTEFIQFTHPQALASFTVFPLHTHLSALIFFPSLETPTKSKPRPVDDLSQFHAAAKLSATNITVIPLERPGK